MATFTPFLAVLLVISGTSAQNVLQSYAVPAAAKPGDNVTFHCVVDQDILTPSTSFCQWARPGRTLVTPGAYPNDDFEFISYPENTSDGKRRCDFVLKSVKIEHHGIWQCQPNLVSGPISENGLRPFKFVVAAAPEPKHPVILINGERNNQVQAQAGQDVKLTCALFNTRPKPDFFWYKVSPTENHLEMIHGVPIVEGEVAATGDDDLRSYNSTITLRIGSHENAMKVRCVVNHTMLTVDSHNARNWTDVALSVQGQATVRQCVQIGSGLSQSIVDGYYCDQRAYYLAGKKAVIEVVFSANPAPLRLEWVVPKFPGNPISSGETRDVFTAHQWEKYLVYSENGDPAMDVFDRPDLYSAKLEINNIAENVAGRYEVRIFNGFVDDNTGEQASRFKFDVQIGEKPPAGVHSGLIIGVVVAIVVVVAIGVVIFAWRNSRMCFAGSATKPEGDAESAEPVAVNASNGQTEGEPKQAASNGGNGGGTTSGLKNRLSKFLPMAGNKKSKEKDGSKAEKVPLDVKKQADAEAGTDIAKNEDAAEPKKDQTTLIYADLDLIKNTNDGPGEKNTIISSEKTEYAEIVGTVPPANENQPPAK